MSDEIWIIEGDCREILPTLATASVDAVVTDPPAGIGFMGKEWDSFDGRCNGNAERDREAGNCGPSAGMGNQPFGYSGSSLPRSADQRAKFVAFLTEVLAECHRIAMPGARLLCWAIPRTSHWTGTAIEDAGWLIENRIAHIFGSGFPKGKSQLKPSIEDWWLARKPSGKVPELNVEVCRVGWDAKSLAKDTARRQAPTTDIRGGKFGKAAGQVPGGYKGSDDSPAGRYPPNLVLQHSPGCRRVGVKRVKGSNDDGTVWGRAGSGNVYEGGWSEDRQRRTGYTDPDGLETVPAYECEENCPVRLLDAISGDKPVSFREARTGQVSPGYMGGLKNDGEPFSYGDTGGASRYFPQFQPDADDLAAAEAIFTYQSKASTADRGPGNIHPTVKSTSLISWLIRLITPPGGLVLDPFMGSGTGAVVAYRENYRFVGIEADPASVAIARRRLVAERDKTPLFD